MAADITMNPCCQAWKEKYSKLEEKRNALRKAVNILQPLAEKVKADNIQLKKAYEEEHARAIAEKDSKEFESAAKEDLESEVTALKSEISLLQQKVGPDASNKSEELNFLKVRVSDGEKEINWLKELLQKEKARADGEEVERKKAAEASKNLNAEKVKDEKVRLLQNQEISRLKELLEKEKLRADAEKKSAELERKKAAEAKKDVNEEQDKVEEVKLLKARVSEGEKEINRLSELLEKEKLMADAEKVMAEAETKKVVKVRKNVNAEKLKDEEVKLLEKEISCLKELLGKEKDKGEEVKLLKTHVSEGEKEINRLNELLEREKLMADAEKKRAEAETKKNVKTRKNVNAEKLKDEEVKVLQNRIFEGEKEISCLKELLEKEKDNSEEVKLLKTHVSEGEKEINRLTDLLEKEKLTADAEKKRFEAETMKVVKARKNVNAEKLKDEEIKLLQERISEGEKEISCLKELLEKEKDKDEEVKLLKTHVLDGEKEINRLTDLLEKEKLTVDAEKLRADTEMIRAEGEIKKVIKARRNVNTEKLKDEEVKLLQKRISEGEKEISKLREDAEKKSAELENDADARKNVNAEKLKDEEVKLLQINVSEGEKEIIRLKKHVEKAKLKAESAKRNAESEKKKATEARKELKVEKGKADQERRLAQIERKEADEYRVQVEALRKEASDAKSLLASQTSMVEEMNKKHDAEKTKMVKKIEHSDRKIAKEKELKKVAEVKKRKAEEELSRGGNFSLQLVEARICIDELQKKLDEQNIISKKKDEDLVMRKIEEQRKLAEINWKKCLEEKTRADRLSQQLQEADLKIDDLHKQIHELSSYRKRAEDSAILLRKDANAESAQVKILKKERKFEKMRAKHALRMAKLEKTRSDLLQEELGRFKLEFLQFSRRLNLLDSCFSPSAGGIEVLEKAEDFKDMLRFNMKEHPFLLEPSQLHRRNESEHLNPGCKAVTGNHFLRHALHRSESMIPLHQGNHCESVPGTDSKLDSLTGGSKRMHFQSSAISSSRTSYNDQRLVGSQENGALSVTASAKLLEENMKFHSRNSSMSGEDTRTRRNENLPAAAETSVRSHPHLDISGKNSGHGRKRKRLLDAVESIGFLYSEDKRLHSQIEEKLSFLHGLVQKKIDEPIKEGKSVVPKILDSSHAKYDKVNKRMKTSHEKEVNMQYACDRDLSKNMEIIACEDPNIFAQECHPANSLLGTEQACIGGICDFVASGPEDCLNFEKAACGDYMKLLDLDNAADEECYKKAMEIPLSPTLPEIGFQDIDTTSIDDNEHVEKRNNHGTLSNRTKISSNHLKCNVSEAPHFSLMHKAETPPGFFDIQSESHIQYSGRKMGMPSIHGSVDEGLAIPFQGESGCRRDSSIPSHFVLFSTSKAKCSNSRIFCAAKTCMDRCSLVTKSEWALADILVAMKMETNLSIQEKVCVFFSLLLLHFSSVASQNSASFLGGNFIPLIDSFAECIRAVISDAESRPIFAEILDMLLVLIEDFLLDGVVIIPDTSSETLCSDSRINVPLDGVNTVFIERVASADQLVAGSIILASVCVAADRTPHLAEVAYNILRTHKYDRFELLTIIHVFAFLGGQKFFTLSRLSMTMTVLKSIVTSMENRHLAVSKTSLLATCTMRPEFHPNSVCPYSDGAISEDVAISLLLETVKQYALSGINQDVSNSSASSLLLQLENNEDSLRHKDACSVPDGSCEASCSLNECAVHATRSESGEGVNLCQFSDILSLVELLADNMSWDWTCTKAVDPLLKLLELPVAENLSVAIVILLGHLGRLGVDACGYEDKGIENLRSKLSAFLLRDTTIRAGLPIQISTVSTLLRLIPLDYNKLIYGTVEETSSLSVPIDFIKKWFCLLSEEQKAFSFSLLQSDSVVTK